MSVKIIDCHFTQTFSPPPPLCRACPTSMPVISRCTVASSPPTVWWTIAWWWKSLTLAATPFSAPSEVKTTVPPHCFVVIPSSYRFLTFPFPPSPSQTCGLLRSIWGKRAPLRKGTSTALPSSLTRSFSERAPFTPRNALTEQVKQTYTTTVQY